MYPAMMFTRAPVAFGLSLAALLAAGTACLADQLPANLIRAELLPGWKTEAGTEMAALRLTLAPGWKTYWRAPGEAGIPPQFDWTASANLAGVAYHWPRPHVFDVNGMRTIAYKNELVLPIEFLPARAGEAVAVSGTIDLGVCQNICVPVKVTVSGTLGTGEATNPAVRAALANLPKSGGAAGIAAPICHAEPIKDGMRLTTDIALPRAADGDFAVIETPDASVWVTNVETRAGGGHLVDVSDLVPSSAAPFALDRSGVTVTLFAGSDVIELHGCKG